MDKFKPDDFTKKDNNSEQEKYLLHLEENNIKDYDQFIYNLNDAMNQFKSIYDYAQIIPSQWASKLKEDPRLHLIDYLKTVNKSIDPEFSQAQYVAQCIKNYDENIDILNSVTTIADLDKVYANQDSLSKKWNESLYSFINTDKKFWDTYLDMKNQFTLLQQDAAYLPIDQVIERSRKRIYKTTDEILKDKNKYNSEDLLSKNKNYTQYISYFNEIVKKVRNLKSKEELDQILEEIEEFLNK